MAATIQVQQRLVRSIQHHFLRAVVPEPGVDSDTTFRSTETIATSSAFAQPKSIAPGASETFQHTLFVGPKLQIQLEAIDESLKLTVDYGWLTIISQPLFWLLSLVLASSATGAWRSSWSPS